MNQPSRAHHSSNAARALPAAVGNEGGKAARSRAALIEAARTVFTRDGYLNARIADITSEAGFSLGSFYTHFESKQQLLRELLDHFWTEVSERTLLPFRLRLSPEEATREAIRGFWFTYKGYLPELTAVAQASAVDVEFLAQWLQIRNNGIASIQRGIVAAQRNGYCAAIDAHLAAAALSSMLEHSCYMWLNGIGSDTPLDDEVAIDTLWTLWYHAIYWKDTSDE